MFTIKRDNASNLLSLDHEGVQIVRMTAWKNFIFVYYILFNVQGKECCIIVNNDAFEKQ